MSANYRVEKLMSEYKMVEENYKEEWLKSFFSSYDKLVNDYEKISSKLSPEAAELIGELRERRNILELLKAKSLTQEDSNASRIYEEVAQAINSGEHF